MASVSVLDERDVAAASSLPGWSRAHAIAHLARNADSHVWLFEGARAGVVRSQYPKPGMREADIEAGATQTASELGRDLADSCAALERAWTALDDDLWDAEGLVASGPRSMSELVFRRLREVEVHHVDLRVGYQSSDWPSMYVEGELRRRVDDLGNRADHRALVEWLLGRASAPELAAW